VEALARPISLKNASIEVIRRFAARAVLGPTVRDTLKGSVAHMRPPVDSVRRAAQRARPRWIVRPRYEAGASSRVVPLSKGRAFMLLAESAFNYDLHGQRGFDALAQLIEACECFEFAYAELEDAVKVYEELATTA
jgi:HprK-related kinase A